MNEQENKNVTISINDEVKSRGVTLAKDLIGSKNLSGVISHLINTKFKELYS